MLQAMQQPTETATSPTSPSFAGMLAALAAPAPKPASAWDDDDLADDIATLSYENALKAHARYRPTDQSLTQAANPETYFLEKPEAAATVTAPALHPMPFAANLESIATPEPERLRAAHFERNLKDASITIRMSKAESEQLHRRAAEAGLTVSAYLRSCTFEAESLRAMVKDTMVQLRTATAQLNPAPARRFWLRGAVQWLAHLLTPWHGNQRVARA
jgi:hypothetical protein